MGESENMRPVQTRGARRPPNGACFLFALIALSLIVAAGQKGMVWSKEPPPIDSPGRGRIMGSVRVKGRVEATKNHPVYKNRDFCGASVPDESLIVHTDGGIKNVVITIGGAVKTDESPSHPIVLDNKNCQFVPHVLIAPIGSEVLLKNSDPILHDVHARLGSRTLFNVGLPAWRQVKKRLTRTGIVTIGCEVLHTWMSAYIVVTSSPFSAVTDEQGRFSIEGVPVGNYQVELWHERLGRISRNVKVKDGYSAVLDVVFAPL